jgi:Lsr2
MEKTITVDDLTGLPSETTHKVSVLFGDAEYTLDLGPESAEAFRALFADHDPAKLRDLLTTPVTAEIIKPSKPKPADKPADDGPTSKEVNEWLKSTGRESEVKHGRASKALKEEYLAAHR